MKKLLLIMASVVGMFGQNVVLPGTTPQPLSVVLQSVSSSMEGESILSLVAEGMKSTQDVVNNLTTWAKEYCTSWPTAQGCGGDISSALTPYVSQLQQMFGLVPASQWNPATFSDNTYVTAAQFSQNQPVATAPASAPSGNVVGACYQTSGINQPTVTLCVPGPGTNSSMAINGQLVVSNGMLYQTIVGSTPFGKSIAYTPVSLQ